ncbi:MAG TPA: hypothetical protein VHB97_22175 [Polyangia bacterium]|nr:hypothetical protein [Polyangia bacterium]
MIRALAVAMAVAVLGCGDDTTAMSTDLSQYVLDLASSGISCGISRCPGECAACQPFAGGICLTPCKIADPSGCPAAQKCHPLVDDGGIVTTLGGNCPGIDGYCGF